MALNDGEGGDIGYIYFSNLGGINTNVSDLPVLDEKLKFSEFKSLQIIGTPGIEETLEFNITVNPGEEMLYLMRKIGSE